MSLEEDLNKILRGCTDLGTYVALENLILKVKGKCLISLEDFEKYLNAKENTNE